MNINENTLPTSGMPLPERTWYLSRKLINFAWRYHKNPRYLFTYLRFISNDKYKENVHFMTDEEFIEAAKTRSSLRLQDGEFTLFLGTRDVFYEKTNPRLGAIWREAIKNYSDNAPYMLGLPPYTAIENGVLHKHAFKYLWMPSKILFRLLFPKNPKYFNGSYFYIDNATLPFMQTLAQERNIIVVTNKTNIKRIREHETIYFPNAKSISYVETPEAGTFDVYDEILAEVKNTGLKINSIVFMACGPAGKAMIYDLAKVHIVAHDVGYGFTGGVLTGESREHFIKWNIFGPIFKKIQQS